MFSLKQELKNYLSRLSLDDGSHQVLLDSIEACRSTRSRSSSEFDFLTTFGNFNWLDSSVEDQINKESDIKAAHDIHRSDLWRKAVISATEVKHSDPMLFADKILAHYDEKFNIK